MSSQLTAIDRGTSELLGDRLQRLGVELRFIGRILTFRAPSFIRERCDPFENIVTAGGKVNGADLLNSLLSDTPLERSRRRRELIPPRPARAETPRVPGVPMLRCHCRDCGRTWHMAIGLGEFPRCAVCRSTEDLRRGILRAECPACGHLHPLPFLEAPAAARCSHCGASLVCAPGMERARR
jgi:ribosomal protein S27E